MFEDTGKVFFQIPGDIPGRRVCCGLSPELLQFGTACVQLQFPTLPEENISGHVVLECACTDKARKGSKKISDDYTELLLFLGVFFPQLHLTWGGGRAQALYGWT